VSDEAVQVIGDETTLRQVLANLLSNTREHTQPHTAVEVRVTALSGGARLEVVDDGAGIEANAHSRVFDRFWRGGREGQTPGGGSGLGLAIVAAVVHAHGGTVRVARDDRMRGAHFVVELPVRPPPPRARRSQV
jgi:two-component system, OmpR family, sensor kinase